MAADRSSADPESPADPSLPPTMRVQRFLARAGVASRRGSEDLMTAGRVQVNGVTVTGLGAKVTPLLDVVTVDGAVVAFSAGPVHLMLNKPAQVMTTMKDPQGRATVADLIPAEEYPGLFPVGRLDYDTTGLLLFTTDGELSHRLLHPKRKVPKTYIAVVDGHPGQVAMKHLREGVRLDDGLTAPTDVRVLERRDDAALMEIVLREGRKRQVRRMFSAVGHPVRELHRIAFGPVDLGLLGSGDWRHLTTGEVSALRAAVGMDD